jgi:hypothetical protein
MPNDPIDRRQDTRPAVGGLPGDITVKEALRVRDLSPSGAMVETSVPLELNSLHDVRLDLGSRTVVVKGRVTHCAPAQDAGGSQVHLSGLEFVELSLAVRQVIAQFLKTMTPH